MYISSKRSTEDQIEAMAPIILAGECCKAIRETNLIEGCLMQMKSDKSRNDVLKAKISDALSTWKIAAKDRFVNILGNSLITIEVTSKQIVSFAQKEDYEYQNLT